MIVRTQGGCLRLITQTDHAHLAAELLSLWRQDGLPEHPRHDELLFATREHDNGWRESDAAPRVDPANGRPFSFLTLPDGPRRELWERGIERHREARPYAALLILEHARALHQRRRTAPGWKRWLERLEEWRQERLQELAIEPRQLEADYCWLRLADGLSLAVCTTSRDPVRFDHPAVEARSPATDLLVIDPFPLAGATTFDLACRSISDRRYTGDAELGGALAAGCWETVRVKVRPR